MISELQVRKLKRFFGLLDFNHNGVIEESDFTSIAENLCVLWGLREDTAEYVKIVTRFSETWKRFSFYVNNEDETASWEYILDLANKYLVKENQEQFSIYVDEFAGEIFDNFDTNNDGHISVDEYLDLFMAYRIEVRYAAKAFRKLDRNDDDEISRAELMKAVKEFFLSTDEAAPGNWLFGAY
ncbi:MAG: EF-hand domain-containing protein [Bacteroidota bacterium]